jgi:hypothetical protein
VSATEDDLSSFPVIGVSSDYWGEVSDNKRAFGELDHSLVVLGLDKNDAQVFDCYLHKVVRTTHCKLTMPRSLTPAQAIVQLPVVRLREYWEQAFTSRYTFYIRRVNRKTQRTLLP